MSESPYHAPLMETVAQIYACSPSRLPPMFEACLCPVCMTADTLAEMIATPVRALTPDHLSEYRNSAHGVPTNPDDLRAILPRFLDLIAQDQWSDTLGVGVDLQRFGDGRITHAPLFDPQTEALLNQWAHLMILHTGWSEAHDQDTNYGLFSLTEVLLVGGWPAGTVTTALDTLFASANGPAALQWFLAQIGTELYRSGHFQTWALDRYRAEAIPAFADWLNDLLTRPAVQAHLLSPETFAPSWADALYSIGGNVTRATFHVPD
ncbi:MAG: hypothetical protein ACRCS3_15965 [Paracoccaceae bacterium]